MINRVLIRIKVVQLLYSYLLIENHFMLESQPSAPTKEKRFAFALYLDLLMLMVRISGKIVKQGGYKPLADTRFIKKILLDDKIKSLDLKYRHEDFPFSNLVAPLAETIAESGLFANFLKDAKEGKADDSIWENIFNIILMPDNRLNAAITTRSNYTLRGVERMRTMMTETFKNFYASRDNLDDALNTLRKSMEKARELYFRLLLLPVEITSLRAQQIEDNRNKFIPTPEDLNPNMRFIENSLVTKIAANEDVEQYCEQNKLSWMPDHRNLLQNLLKEIMDSELYAEYMGFPVTDEATDCEFWRNVFKQIILHNEDFLETLETESIFWNDDLEIIGTFLLKSLKRFTETDGKAAVLPMYKDAEDAAFGKALFSDVVKNKDVYRRYIDESVNEQHWDSERLAFMDVIIAMTAISEIINFPKIPVVVSINEYIEIAKSYSTSKSGGFVNGLLATIVSHLREQNIIQK